MNLLSQELLAKDIHSEIITFNHCIILKYSELFSCLYTLSAGCPPTILLPLLLVGFFPHRQLVEVGTVDEGGDRVVEGGDCVAGGVGGGNVGNKIKQPHENFTNWQNTTKYLTNLRRMFMTLTLHWF